MNQKERALARIEKRLEVIEQMAPEQHQVFRAYGTELHCDFSESDTILTGE